MKKSIVSINNHFIANDMKLYFLIDNKFWYIHLHAITNFHWFSCNLHPTSKQNMKIKFVKHKIITISDVHIKTIQLFIRAKQNYVLEMSIDKCKLNEL